MKKNLLSVIIPSRSPQFLKKTVDDLLNKAKEEIEIIIVLDGIWLENIDEFSDDRIKIIHHGTIHNSVGMRDSINRGMAIANGEFLAKTDEHCMFSFGFDKILKENCGEHDIVVPRRKRLDPEKWENINDGRADIDYMYVEFPFARTDDKTCGLHGAIWKERTIYAKDAQQDFTPTIQGSFYCMRKSHWDSVIKFLDSDKYGPFQQEAQEITFKTFFTKGKVIRVKNCWYSHLHKGTKYGKGYGFSNAQYKQHAIDSEKGRIYCRDYWLNTTDYECYGWNWDKFMKLFPDMPGWEKDWKKQIEEAQKLETSLTTPTLQSKEKESPLKSNIIIGNGDLATVLKKCEDKNLLFFASGVSNSAEKRESEFQREKDLLLKQDKNKHIVYFSSLCIFHSDNRYTKHKKEMEELIKKTFSKYCIVRLGNISWGNNPHTLLNFFRNKIKNNEPLEIRDVYRYVIDEEEFLYIVNMIPDWSCEFLITGKRMKAIKIVEQLKKEHQRSLSIPRKIHQIWIGNKKMPIEWMNTWKEKNPSFEYTLWDEKKIDELNLKNRDKYDIFMRKGIYDGAADIARIEILEKFGGIYIDADSVCLETLEGAPFINKNFFAVLEYDRRVANGVIGATAGHPIIKDYVKRISEATLIEPPCYTIGGTMLTSCIDAYGEDDRLEILPTNSFYPKNYEKNKDKIKEKVYSIQKWGTTKNLYEDK